MTEHRRRKPAVLAPEHTGERFDTGGRSFMESLRLVLAGGRSEGHESESDVREKDK